MSGSLPNAGLSRRRLRVAIAMPGGFDFGGIGRMMHYATRGWEGPDAPDWWLVDGRGDGSLLWSPLMLLRASLGLVRRRPDLLHLNVANKGSTLRKLVLSLAARGLRIPTIVHLHYGAYGPDLARRSALVRRLVVAMFRRARLVIVLGRNDARLAEDVLGVASSRILVVHNAVPDPGPVPDRRHRSGPVRLLFLGRFDAPEKAVDVLLTALAAPALLDRDWHLVVAGRGDKTVLAAPLALPGIAERITFVGWLPQAEVYERCREADILLLPSHSEGQAMSLLEAMAHGLAIVTTPVGAHLEAVTDQQEALIVPPGDASALGAAIARLIDDRDLRVTLGSNARARYCGAFDASQYSNRLRQIYSRALGE